ncbi:MAG TPA: lysine exporter LysO family protein [Thermoanaerobacterales bacterium]|nr:lysine exporter LysO family protein [Thermoanaerobacterales bacterium]
MVWMPYVCIGIGLILGLNKLSDRLLRQIDIITTIMLIVLMLTIGMNIGVNDSVISNLNLIGFNCIVISLSAIAFSVIFTIIVEKTILPLDEISKEIRLENINISEEIDLPEEENKKSSPLLWLMPISIIIGVAIGYFVMPDNKVYILDYLLTASLIVLYIGAGITIGANRKVFEYIKILGFKVVFLSLAILAGSIIGGVISGLILKLPLNISVISASGMSYYSLTGAYMTQMYGIKTGTYGFIVNVMREFFTVLFMPLLVKISKGSPIAGGAAGNMDTMLVPITKVVGADLGLVTLITGTILTFIVPFLLPFLSNILV